MALSIERDILSIPEILRLAHGRVGERAKVLQPLLTGPTVFLGSGSSYCVGQAAAALYEQAHHVPAQAVFPSDYVPREGWTHVAVSRTGETTEVVTAMRRIRAHGGRCLLVTGEAGSPAEAEADAALVLEFAAEQGVIQTRFIIAALEALRLLIGGIDRLASFSDLPANMERSLKAFDPAPLIALDHWVFLGRGWRYGLARAAALNLTETALLVAEGHQTLDYRHGPLATADEGTGICCFDSHQDRESAAVVAEARQTGATVYWPEDDPLIVMAQMQLLALRKAEARGIDPTAPRNLRRAIILPDT